VNSNLPNTRREINLNLDSLYFEVKENIDRVRFDELWQGFAPFKFALYDAEKCFFNVELSILVQS
jgi:hypothetical protein